MKEQILLTLAPFLICFSESLNWCAVQIAQSKDSVSSWFISWERCCKRQLVFHKWNTDRLPLSLMNLRSFHKWINQQMNKWVENKYGQSCSMSLPMFRSGSHPANFNSFRSQWATHRNERESRHQLSPVWGGDGPSNHKGVGPVAHLRNMRRSGGQGRVSECLVGDEKGGWSGKALQRG